MFLAKTLLAGIVLASLALPAAARGLKPLSEAGTPPQCQQPDATGKMAPTTCFRQKASRTEKISDCMVARRMDVQRKLHTGELLVAPATNAAYRANFLICSRLAAPAATTVLN